MMPGSAEIDARMNELLEVAEKWRSRAEELEEALDQAVYQLGEHESRESFLERRLEQLQQAVNAQRAAARRSPAPAAAAGSAGAPGQREPGPGPDLTVHPSYDSLDDWVDQWLSRHIERDPSNRFRWCARWREHPEALLRLEVLFSEYLRARTDPRIGMGNFVRSGLDHHVPQLLASDGPFMSCDPAHHEPAASLPTRAPAVAAAEGA